MPVDLRIRKSLSALTGRIIGSYAQAGGLNHLGHSPLPSYREVVRILADLREILLPGYGRRQRPDAGNVEGHVGGLIDRLYERLTRQIIRALGHGGESSDVNLDLKAEQHAMCLLEALPDLRQALGDDARAAFDGDPAARSLDEIVFCYPGLVAIAVFRVAHELHRMGVPLIPRMMTEYAHSRTGIDLHPGATIGRRFFIDHGTGVVVGETTEIGDDVKVYQGVTLGALSFPRSEETGELCRDVKRHPTIEDDVIIYANATILGGQTVIGRHAVIGSSAWITRSVAPDTTVTIESPPLRYRGTRVA